MPSTMYYSKPSHELEPFARVKYSITAKLITGTYEPDVVYQHDMIVRKQPPENTAIDDIYH